MIWNFSCHAQRGERGGRDFWFGGEGVIERLARHACLLIVVLVVACSGIRVYYLHSELRKLEGDPNLAVAPGPWKNPDVPIVASNEAGVPDGLVVPLLHALMRLPGAADACDPNTGHPRPDAAEYCIAVYKTSKDWRAAWPVRSLMGETNSCQPPYGGVDDEDFGQDMIIFGFAHNHPCGTNMSSPDLGIFPVLKSGEGGWTMVAYAATPSGKLAVNSRGQLIPAWAWLATGRPDNPRYYKWNQSGQVFRWKADKKSWEFQATCTPQSSNLFSSKVLPPKCSPELH